MPTPTGGWGGHSLFWFGEFKKETKLAKKIAKKMANLVK